MGGVLDPQGPVGAAERLILINADGDHAGDRRAGDRADARLRLVVPRRQHHAPATCRTGSISGPVELVVWSIPALVIMFLGGIAWIGSHDLDPAKPLASAHEAARHPGRVARLEVAVHLPRAGRRQRQPARRAGRHAAALHAHLGKRHEQLLRAAARQPDLHHGRHDDAAPPAGRPARHLSRPVARSSAATASPTCASTSWRCRAERFDAWVAQRRAAPAARSTRDLRSAGAAEHRPSRCAFGAVEPACSTRSSGSAAAGRGRVAHPQREGAVTCWAS